MWFKMGVQGLKAATGLGCRAMSTEVKSVSIMVCFGVEACGFSGMYFAPACLRYVDFPLLFGPVITRKFMNGLWNRICHIAQKYSQSRRYTREIRWWS